MNEGVWIHQIIQCIAMVHDQEIHTKCACPVLYCTPKKYYMGPCGLSSSFQYSLTITLA